MKKKFLAVFMIFSLLTIVSCATWQSTTASIVAGAITRVIAPRNLCTLEEADLISQDLEERLLTSPLFKEKSLNKGLASSLCVALVRESFEVGLVGFPLIYKCAGDFIDMGVANITDKVCSEINM